MESSRSRIFEAYITGKNDVSHGLVENLDVEGVYVRMLGSHFIPNDKVTLDLFVTDLSKTDHIFSAKARIVRVDSKGAYLRFYPMEISQYLKLTVYG
jgi:hypothetical protein